MATAVLSCWTATATANDALQMAASIQPFHYDVVLLPILERHPRLCGHVFIDAVALQSINIINIHAAGMNVLDASLRPLDADTDADAGELMSRAARHQVQEACFSGLEPKFVINSTGVQLFSVDEKTHRLWLIFDEPLRKGRRYRIGVSYSASVGDDIRGFFRKSYVPDGECCPR